MLAALIDEAERTGRMDPASSMSALRSTLLPHTTLAVPSHALPRASHSVDEGPRDPATTVKWVGQGEGSGWPRGSRVQLHSLKSKEHNG